MEKKRQDLRNLKLSEEQIDEMLGGDEDESGVSPYAPTDFMVMPENWDSVQVFSGLNRCWRINEFNGHYLGLDRPSIESTLRLMGILPEQHRDIFGDLQIMETAALEILNRDHK